MRKTFPTSWERREALAGSATRPPRAGTGLLVPEVTTLSPVFILIIIHLLFIIYLACDGDLAENGQGVARKKI